MTTTTKIARPTDAALADLCTLLKHGTRDANAWPATQLRRCSEQGVFAWFAPPSWEGRGWSSAEIMEAYVHLAGACLTTTFVLTQLTGALRRIVSSSNEALLSDVLPELIRGERLVTLGISHLTTSRQHLGKPALQARQTPDGYVLDGVCPWVTGASCVDYVVIGATLEDGHQVLLLLPRSLPGMRIPAPKQLVALTGSQTGPVEFTNTPVDSRWLLAGPEPEIMKQGGGGHTGGLQTSALAIGLASAAVKFMQKEAERRADLIHPAEQLRAEWDRVYQDLQAAARDAAGGSSTVDLRTRANSLVLRATQAALSAAKGAGYIEGHPAGRWCREALFFLVWSCPQQVVDANLCEFAGIS